MNDARRSTPIFTMSSSAAASKPEVQTKLTLEGKVIAITGANRGIGLGVAESCLDNGAKAVYSIDIADQPGDEFVAAQKKHGADRLKSIQADITKEASVTAAIDKVIEEQGAIHGMVVNAGRTNHKAALDFSEEEILALFSVNVSAVLEGDGGVSQRANMVDTVVRSSLQCEGGSSGVHQAGHQRVDCLYSLHGLISPQQGRPPSRLLFTSQYTYNISAYPQPLTAPPRPASAT